MIKPIVAKLKPASGVSHFLHLALLILLPIAIFVFVRLGDTFTQLAYVIVILSKWRMFAVRPRFWPAIIRANAIDIIVGVSLVLFMVRADSQWQQLLWAILYGGWLIGIKPATGTIATSVQAMIGQLFGLTAIYLTWSTAPSSILVLATGAVCYLAARHYFESFDEPYNRLLSFLWGYFGAALAWLLGHWLLFYAHGIISQPTLILSVLGYGLAVTYYFDHVDRLNPLLKRQFIFIMIAIVLVILTFSDWSDKVI
jgi:hypothetical protein